MLKRLIELLALALLAAGCGAQVGANANDDDVIVPEGKEDDFYSSAAAEYWVAGTGTVTVEDGLTDAAALKRAPSSWCSSRTSPSAGSSTRTSPTRRTRTPTRPTAASRALTRFASEDGRHAHDDRSQDLPVPVQGAGRRRQEPGDQARRAVHARARQGVERRPGAARLQPRVVSRRAVGRASIRRSRRPTELEKMPMTITAQTASSGRVARLRSPARRRRDLDRRALRLGLLGSLRPQGFA